MRFLGVGDDNSLGDMYVRLAAAGHEVRVFVGKESSRDTLAGLIDHVPDWRAELPWVRAAGPEGIVLFETATMGAEQDALRAQGYHIVGGSSFGDRLETERAFGQECLRAVGLRTAPTERFSSFDRALDYVRRRPRRYVLKLNGSEFSCSRNVVGSLDDGRDIAGLICWYRDSWAEKDKPSFVIMDHVEGVEVGVGGYFNGERFMDPVVIDWEHKRFFNDDVGELTGEMGTLVSYENSAALFNATLAKMAGPLREANHVGYVNLNTIVNADGIWPLEFTSRFGYPGFCICDALHAEGWDQLFARMVTRRRLDFATHPGFGIGVTLSVPPFPYSDRYDQLSKGLPILFRRALSDEEKRHLHFCEVEMKDGALVTSGEIGYLMVVTGMASDVETARRNSYGLVEQVAVPNMRYRTDIGLRFLNRDRALMREWNLWP